MAISNSFFQAIALVILAAHAGALGARWVSPHGFRLLLALNAILAIAVLLYAMSRLRYILAAKDWPYLGLVGFELAVLAGAFWAYRDSRFAVGFSYLAFVLHALISIGAVVFAFGFKFTRLM